MSSAISSVGEQNPDVTLWIHLSLQIFRFAEVSKKSDSFSVSSSLLLLWRQGWQLPSCLHVTAEARSPVMRLFQSSTYFDIFQYTNIFQSTSMFFMMVSVQFSSVAQSCPTLCDPTNRSMPGLPVHHQLPEFTQTHVHRVSDAFQPSHPLSSPSPPAPNSSQHQSLFQWVNSSHEVAKVLEFQL